MTDASTSRGRAPATGPGRWAGRRAPLLVMVPLILVAIAIGGGLALMGPGPNPSQAPASGRPAAFPPPVAPLLVNIHRAGSGPVGVGFPVQVSASALGMTGVAGLELWAGGTRVEVTANVDPARPAARARWAWTPAQPGETILVARGFDSQGRTTQSAPLRLTVVAEPPRSYRLIQIVALEGETLDVLTARVGGDVPLARYLNEDLAEGAIPAGTLVDVPKFDEVGPPAAARVPDLSDARLVAEVAAILPAGLATPEVNVTVNDCTVTATATNGGASAAGFAFSALPPIADSFIPLPPVAAEAGGTAEASFVALAGTNYLTTSSYTEAGSATSAIVPFVVPPGCGAGGWTGDARLDGGKLIAGGNPDEAYLYLRVGDGAWQRIPSAAGAFVTPVDGVLDFGPLLPSIAGKDLQLEAWGWTGGSLAKLGAGSYTAPGETLYSGGLKFGGDPLLGFGTSLDIVVIPGGGEFPEQLARHSAVDLPGPNSASGKRSFKWSTTVPGVTHLAWQVLPYPLGESSTNLAPPFLIDAGTIEVGGTSTGYFTLDLKSYLLGTGGSSGVWSSTLLGEQLISNVVQTQPFNPAATPAPAGNVIVDPGNLWWPQPTGGASGTTSGPADVSKATLEDLSFLIPPPSTLFVRVIPFLGAMPFANASNPVSFDVIEPGDPIYIDTSPPPPPPSYDGAFTYTAQFFAPTGSIAKYARCVQVVKNGKVLSNSLANYGYALYGGYDWSSGTVHCLPPPDDDDGWSLSDAFDTFAGWVGDVWDFVSDGYGWMQDKVVEAVLTFVPCEQIAGQVTDNSKEVCTKIAKTALQAALASFGIPPEIPDWESTISAAKGDLKEFILENAQQFPAVSAACTAASATNQVKSDFPTCEALVDKAVDTAISQIVEDRSAAAAANAGVMVPPGVIVEPDPRSMAQPPHFEIVVTRTNLPVPADVVCTINARMTSEVAGWSWLEYSWKDGQATVVKKTGDVTGEPFLSVKQVIAPLAEGQSAAYELWLTKTSIWFEPDGWNDHYAEQYAEWNGSNNHAWVLLQTGTTVTGSFSSNCLPDGSGDQILTGQAWN